MNGCRSSAMAAIKPLFLFTLFLILKASSSSSSNDNDFDTFQLVLQWNPATCSDKDLSEPCYQLPSNKFSISGLWPTRLSPFQVLGPCEGISFDPDAISNIQFRMHQNWPDMISGKDEELWKKEWEKYGTCSEAYLDQLEYFDFALNSAAQHNLLRVLEGNGITPVDAVYERNNVQEALRRAIGVRPALRCNVNNLSRTEQLHEIGLCYFKESEAPRNCPTRASTCGSTFEWFPYMRRLYGYFQVAFQWQPATCFNTNTQTRPCFQSPELRFSLNGVWPTRRSHVILRSCRDTTFDNNQISSIRARLDRAWPDLTQRRNDQLWENEWKNYGTCSEDQFGQLLYFSFGLHALEGNDILSMLRRNNITPNGQSYRKLEVENAIIRSIGVRPYLLCNARLVNQRQRTQLHQIILCYDDNGRRLQDCPSLARPLAAECPGVFDWYV